MYITILSLLLAIQSLFVNHTDHGNAAPSVSQTIFHSSDDGLTWQDNNAGLPKDFQPANIYAGIGEVLLSSESGLYRSINFFPVPMWEKVIFPFSKIITIYPGYAGPYAATTEGEFFQEMQGSGIWIPVNFGLKNKSIYTLLETPDGSTFIGSDAGIFKSVDGRLSWKQVLEADLINSILNVDGVLIGAGWKGMYRSTDNGEKWQEVTTQDVTVLKTEIIDGGMAAIFFGGNGNSKEVNTYGKQTKLVVSTDKGITWTAMDTGFPQVRDIYDLVKAGKNLYCSLDSGIYRSTDQGQSWSLVLPSIGKTRFDLAVSGQMVFAIKVNGGC